VLWCYFVLNFPLLIILLQLIWLRVAYISLILNGGNWWWHKWQNYSYYKKASYQKIFQLIFKMKLLLTNIQNTTSLKRALISHVTVLSTIFFTIYIQVILSKTHWVHIILGSCCPSPLCILYSFLVYAGAPSIYFP
jgi:hypothetical protein